jgi:hypothetical protein
MQEELRMLIRNPVAEWTRDHPAGEELRRTVFAEKGQATQASFDFSPADAVLSCGTPVVLARPEPPSAAGRLARILPTMVRQAYVGARERERTRANADRLLETIRVLSSL